MNSVSANEARENLDRLLDDAASDHEPVLIRGCAVECGPCRGTRVECDLVERVPGKMGGRPVIRGRASRRKPSSSMKKTAGR